MINFIEEIKNKYDVVLFDSPPLIAVTDPYVLLKHVIIIKVYSSQENS